MNGITVRKISSTVVALGMVSFFTDVSSEMIYPLLPVFLTQTLGASPMTIGVIEGIAETVASLFKFFSGVWTDKYQKRKLPIVFGYSISGMARPLIGIAPSWPFVLAIRFFDRLGKGIRTSPRDALIADVTAVQDRGHAYGIYRSLDHAGAMTGPLVAGALLLLPGMKLKTVFLLSAIPAIIALSIAIFFVRESKVKSEQQGSNFSWKSMTLFDSDFRRLMLGIVIFTLGNSTDAFLLLKLSNIGVTSGMIAIYWALFNFVKMTSSFYLGSLSDTYGSKKMMLLGWYYYAAIYVLLALVSNKEMIIFLFLLYGIHFGLVEPSQRSMVSKAVSAKLRGTAFGLYNLCIGISSLPASVLFGWIWQTYSPSVAFFVGASLALAASLLIYTVKEKDERSTIFT